MTTSRAVEGGGDRTSRRPWVLRALILVLAFLLVCTVLSMQACTNPDDASPDNSSTSSTVKGDAQSGDIQGFLDEEIDLGDAVITVRALQSTFQPAMPAQRLSQSTPSAPGVGESFYQALVRVKNKQETPLRVDPRDFACAVGGRVVSIEPTRSGPYARSLLENTSLDLLLTFKGPAGFQPELIYSPSWYEGVITIGPRVEQQEETTTT